MKYIIKESQYKKLFVEEFSQKVADAQKLLIQKGYDLGKYGPNKDGVDGIAGPLTRKALKKELEIKNLISKDADLSSDSYFDAVLVGGLDTRNGDYDINTQVEFLKEGIGQDKKVKGFRWNTPTSTIINFLNKNPRIPIFLFSAGCTKAAELSTNPDVNVQKLYIIEPYAASTRTKNIVQTAVSNGVPSKNVFVGNSIGRGENVVAGASSSNSNSHWGALKSVGRTIKI